jgi:hypothetical protein
MIEGRKAGQSKETGWTLAIAKSIKMRLIFGDRQN